MTVYVYRDGKLVEKGSPEARAGGPYVSRMEPYESPIDGHEVTSWRERDREMRSVDAYDPRDLPKDHHYEKGRNAQPFRDAGIVPESIWRDRDGR